eukprot:Phypoly_transcript_11772.p1 GENE.Phypoly_transcript_11772~~Phypoly_transcript_11772.p1  ORF type:complete len:347 (+),score=55.63 Phypoly_transcript_11772:89-1129(+)
MDLSKVKLRKTETKESKAPNVVLCATSEDYSRLMHETYIEQYIEIIKPWTFKSQFIQLSREALELLISFHQKFSKDPGTRSDFRNNEPLINLAKQIDEAKKEMGVDGIFVRLSSRSPKDAALLLPDFASLYQKEIEDVRKENNAVCASDASLAPNSETNTKLHALYRASTVALRASDGLSAIDLLITSKRIQGDLEQALQQKEAFNVVVREFIFFDVKYEFRGFVYGKKMTAITQYNELVYFPLLLLQKEKIQKKILEFFNNELMPKLTSLSNYVIDFILIEKGDSFDTYIVELNPFAEFAGGGLFSWVSDLDVLMGKKPLEFRLVTQPASDYMLKTMYNDFSKFI